MPTMKSILSILCLVAACSSIHRSTQASQGGTPLVSPLAYFGEGGGAFHAETAESVETAEPEEKNILAVFAGYTSERGEGGVTIGLDYERRINSWLGIGGFGEVVLGSDPASAFGVGPYFRPIEKLVLVVAPGIEFERGDSGRAMLRLGGAYDLWEWNGMTIAPAAYADVFRDSVALVFGFNFAWGY